jgi:hypothetical protein
VEPPRPTWIVGASSEKNAMLAEEVEEGSELEEAET